MKVVLIEPNSQQRLNRSQVSLSNVDINEPIGLCYVNAYIKRNGHDCRVIHQLDTGNEQVLKTVSSLMPDVIGFSVYTYSYPNALNLARKIKHCHPKIQIVFGGVHASMDHSVIKESAIDYVVIGEGEKTFLELINSIQEGRRDQSSIEGIAFIDATGGLIKTKPRVRMTADELNDLPFPDRTDLDMSRYKRYSLSYPPPSKQKHASINFGRGCKYSCSFCTSPKQWANTYISRSVDNVLDEIDFLKKEYGINYLFIRDEDFLIDQNKVAAFCEKLIEMDWNIGWYCHARVSDVASPHGKVNTALLKLMKKAGCFEIVYGIESGDTYTLNKYKKNINLTQVKAALKATKKAGLNNGCLFMIGASWETKETLNATYEFVKTLPYDRIRITFATPFKGTQFYNVVRDSIIETDEELYTTEYPVLRTHVTPGELVSFRRQMFKALYLRPTYLSRMLKMVINNPKLTPSLYEWMLFLYRNLKCTKQSDNYGEREMGIHMTSHSYKVSLQVLPETFMTYLRRKP